MASKNSIKSWALIWICLVMCGVTGCAVVMPGDLKDLGKDFTEAFDKQVDKQIEKVVREYERLEKEKEVRKRIEKEDDRLYEEIKEVRGEIYDSIKDERARIEKQLDKLHGNVKEQRKEIFEYINRNKDEQHASKLLMWIAIASITALVMLFLNLIWKNKKD